MIPCHTFPQNCSKQVSNITNTAVYADLTLHIILTSQLHEHPSYLPEQWAVHSDTCYKARIRIAPEMLSGTIIQPAQQGTYLRYTSKHIQLAYARRVYQYHALVSQ